jgi:enterochelin esterase-like enzyme
VFGKLAMLSGGLNSQDTYWSSYLSGQKDPPPTLHIWMSAGSYEGSIYENSRAIQAYLEQAGIPTTAVYAHHGHSFGAWRERASEMMQHFFPSRR